MWHAMKSQKHGALSRRKEKCSNQMHKLTLPDPELHIQKAQIKLHMIWPSLSQNEEEKKKKKMKRHCIKLNFTF